MLTSEQLDDLEEKAKKAVVARETNLSLVTDRMDNHYFEEAANPSTILELIKMARKKV